MNVVRKMAVMSNNGSVNGFVRIEKLDKNMSGGLYLNGKDLRQCILLVKVNDLPVFTVDILNPKQTFSLGMAEKDPEKISALIIDGFTREVISRGSNCGEIDEEAILREAEYINNVKDKDVNIDEIEQNENTYNDVSVNTESVLDGIEDAVYNSETPVEVGDSEEIPIIAKDSMYDKERPFYKAIGMQLEDLFARYDREDILEKAIEGSRFARIYYDDNNYYVIGEIKGETGETELICYGYPGEGGKEPPAEIKDNCEWLPLGEGDKGYYMMYQDGISGDVIKKN